MASMLNFLTAISSLLGSSGNSGATFTLSGSGDSLSFPVSPSSFEVRSSYQNTTVDINSLGEMNMLGKRGLKTLTLKSFFPAQYYGFEQIYPQEDPYASIDRLEAMATSGQPCRISISGTSISMPCTIQNLSYGEKDGTGDIYFTVDLKEYRYFLPSAEDALNEATGLKSRVASTVTERTISIYPGDDAMDVAARAASQFTSITDQQKNRLSIFKQIVRSGKVETGTGLKATRTKIYLSDDTALTF